MKTVYLAGLISPNHPESMQWRADVSVRLVAAGFPEGLDFPERVQVERNHRGLAVGGEGPGELLFAEILGYLDGEDAPLAAGEEVRGLAQIRAAGLDAVVGADRNIQLLLQVSIVITHKDAITSVGILKPSLEGAGEALAGIVGRLEGQLLGAQQRGEEAKQRESLHEAIAGSRWRRNGARPAWKATRRNRPG